MDTTTLVLGICGLAAVWIYTSGKIQAASIAANPFSPAGLNAIGNGVGAATGGLASIIAAINGPGNGTTSMGGTNSGGGPLGGQTSDMGGGAGTTAFGDANAAIFGDNLTGGGLQTAGGTDGGDTSTTWT